MEVAEDENFPEMHSIEHSILIEVFTQVLYKASNYCHLNNRPQPSLLLALFGRDFFLRTTDLTLGCPLFADFLLAVIPC